MNLRCSVRKQASDNTLAPLSQCSWTHTEHFKNLLFHWAFMKGQTNQVLILNLTKADLLQRRMPCEVGLSEASTKESLSLRASCFSCGGEEKPSCISSYLGQKSEPLRLSCSPFPPRNTYLWPLLFPVSLSSSVSFLAQPFPIMSLDLPTCLCIPL